MGNVNESKEQEDCSSLEGSSDTSSINIELGSSDELSNAFLEQDTHSSDLPIKFCLSPGRSASDVEVNTSDLNLGTPPLVEASITSRNSSEHVDKDDSDAEVSRDDSFPLSESAIPSSFDLLVESSPALTEGSDIFYTPDISQLDIISEGNALVTEVASASADIPENQIHVSQSTEESESRPTNDDDKLSFHEALEEASLASPVTVACSITQVASPEEVGPTNDEDSTSSPLHEQTLEVSCSDLLDATCINDDEEVYPDICEGFGDTPDENKRLTACDASVQDSFLLDFSLVSQDIAEATSTIASVPCMSDCESNEHSNQTIDHTTPTTPPLQPGDHDISQSSLPITEDMSKSEPESDIGESFKIPRPQVVQVCDSEEEKSDHLAPETINIAGECDSTSDLYMAHAELEDICDHSSIGTRVYAEIASDSLLQESSWPSMSPEESTIFLRDIAEVIFAACDGIEKATLSDAQSAKEISTTNNFDVSLDDQLVEQTSPGPQHTADRPNWALAPRSTNVEGEQNSMTESGHSLSLAQELGAQPITYFRRRPNKTFVPTNATAENTPSRQNHHNASSRRARPGRKINTVVDDKNTTHIRARQGAYEHASRNTSLQPKLQDHHPPLNKALGLGRRNRGGSISFSQNISMTETIASDSPELSTISESLSASPRYAENHGTHLNPNLTNKKEESVEEKIAAIISETRRSKYKTGQQLNAVGRSKAETIPRKTSLASLPKVDTHKRGRVSWPSKGDEEVLQTNVRPPLPWRTGLGRALSTHLTSTETQPKTSQSFEDCNKHKVSSDNKHPSKGRSLQVGHEDFPLHAQEDNEPVKVNLPTPPKQFTEQLSQQVDFDMASNAPARSTFYSNIPVATRTTVAHKSLGPSDNVFVSSSRTSEQPVQDAWKSVHGSFPLVPPIRRGLAFDPSALNTHNVTHMNRTVPQQAPSLRNIQSFPTLSRMSEHDNGLNHTYSGNHYLSQNFIPRMMQGGSPRPPNIAPVTYQQPRSSYPALQRSNSRDLLNQTYDQGQYHERAFVQQGSSSGSGSVVSVEQEAINDLRNATVDGWIANFALGYPQYPALPHGRRHASYQSAMSLTPPQLQQQRLQRHFPELNENPVNQNRNWTTE